MRHFSATAANCIITDPANLAAQMDPAEKVAELITYMFTGAIPCDTQAATRVTEIIARRRKEEQCAEGFIEDAMLARCLLRRLLEADSRDPVKHSRRTPR